MSARLKDVVERVSVHINKVMSGIAATVAITPIPTSDIYILLIIQCTLVTIIASLSGRDISMDTAKEFIFSVGSIGAAGYGFKLIAQQASKLLNFIVPAGGTAVSSSVAYAGTYTIGKSAISYYIEGKDIEDIRIKFRGNRK